MSTRASERLHQLLPALYRGRDGELAGRPLEHLLGLLGGEMDTLRATIRQLADDHFVERASSQALLLLAELYGARLLASDVRVNRGVVARSVAWRRRRGTLATLEEVLSITTGWSTEVDESFRSLLHTQDARHPVPWRGRSAVLWDPIATADPLARNAPDVALPPPGVTPTAPLVGRRADESLAAALHRMGRADAGRHAASPRTLDLNGWSRPDVAIIRTARLTPIELEGVTPAPRVTVTTPTAGEELLGMRLDPLDRDQPLVWLQPVERPDTIPVLTELHEPNSEESAAARSCATLLTPTALAASGDVAEAQGALEIQIDGVQLIGPSRPPVPRAALPFEPLGPQPVLRFADTTRPSRDDEFAIKLLARQSDGDVVMAAAGATRGVREPLLTSDRARTELGDATAMLRVRRFAGAGATRAADGTWTRQGSGSRLGAPLGPAAVIVEPDDTTVLMRAELHEAQGSLRLARRTLGASNWQAVALADTVPAPEPGALLVDAGDAVLMVIPERNASGELVAMGLYRVAVAGTSATSTQVVADHEIRPPPRTNASLAIHDQRLYLFGGSLEDALLDDLWSIAVDGSEASWTPHPVRNAQRRRGAWLLSIADALLLVGGEDQPGTLATTCFSLTPTAPRLRWSPLPALPFASERPGTLIAHHDGTGLNALVWADSTRPRLCRLDDGAPSWTRGALEDSATNPPAPGEGVFAGDRFRVLGPPPLPNSEVILSMAGRSVLAFLPDLDLGVAPLDTDEALLDDEAANAGLSPRAYATFHVATDGSTWRVDDDALPLHPRHGGALHAARASRLADGARLGIPGLLSRRYFALRQRSLGAWDRPYVAEHSDIVGLDPRLGRVLLPRNVQDGRMSVSYRVGRGSAIGAGALPPDRTPREHWQEPDGAAPVPPDLRTSRGPSQPRYSAWVDPLRAGRLLPSEGMDMPVVGSLQAAAAQTATAQPSIGVLRSASVAPARLVAGVESGVSIVATDFGATPMVQADAGDRVSLAIHPDRAGDATTDVWLAGLWLAGRLDLAMSRGEVDIRWCTLASPGELAIRLPGGGHQSRLTRRSLPEATLELRLYGCVVGAIRVPPWVRVIAAGCTFDAGAADSAAIRAYGADVRLRHCTLRGTVEAGQLSASSCVFAGSVRVDRHDRGWIRHSLLPAGQATPQQYHCIEGMAAFSATRPTDPRYLVLSDSNGEAALAAGEMGRIPGAHAERRGRLRELDARTTDFLPVGLVPHHIDRSTRDLTRMDRTTRRFT